MAVKTQAEIQAEAAVVQNETERGANTASRVGGVLVDLADSAKFTAAIGDVVGPGSSATGEIAVFSSETGKAIAGAGGSVASVLSTADAAAAARDATVVAGIPTAGGAPVEVTKAAAAAGSASTWSKSDHKHDVSTATVGQFSVSGVAASEGNSSSLARADHVHSLTGTLPIANGGTGLTASGAAGNFLISDGSNFVSTILPTPVDGGGLTNANVTKSVSNGSKFTLPAATLSGSTKTVTFDTTGTPEQDEIVEVIVYAQSQDYIVAAAAGTIYTVSAGTKRAVHIQWDGVAWQGAGKIRIT